MFTGDAQTVIPTAQSDDPTDLQPPTDDATPDVEIQQAAEADVVAPSIPAEIPDHVVLPRLADRSAVAAPADAIGNLQASDVSCDGCCCLGCCLSVW